MPRTRADGDSKIVLPVTPMLDLSFQLLLFSFVVSFYLSILTASADTGALVIHLKQVTPKWPAALPAKGRRRLRFAAAVVLVPGRDPMSPLEAKAWLKDMHSDLEKEAKGGKVRTVIQFRPDGDLDLNQLFLMARFCKAAGFKKVQLHQPAGRKAIDVVLPAADAGAGPVVPLPPEPEPAAISPDVTISVRASAHGKTDGLISAIEVRPTGGKGKPRTVEGLDGLKKHLKAGRAANVLLQGDARLKVGELIKVMDACRDAGVGKITLAPDDSER